MTLRTSGVTILVLGLLLLIPPASGAEQARDELVAEMEQLKELLSGREAQIEELLSTIADFRESQIPGQSPPGQELTRCRETVRRKNDLIAGLEKALAECRSDLGQCRDVGDGGSARGADDGAE